MLLQPEPPALLQHSELVTPRGIALNRPQQSRNRHGRKTSRGEDINPPPLSQQVLGETFPDPRSPHPPGRSPQHGAPGAGPGPRGRRQRPVPPAGTYQGLMARLGGSSAAPRRAQAGTGRRARPGLQRGGPGGTAASCPAAMAVPAHAHPEAERPPAGTRAGSGRAGSARAAEPRVPAVRSPRRSRSHRAGRARRPRSHR